MISNLQTHAPCSSNSLLPGTETVEGGEFIDFNSYTRLDSLLQETMYFKQYWPPLKDVEKEIILEMHLAIIPIVLFGLLSSVYQKSIQTLPCEFKYNYSQSSRGPFVY